ncbi:hypothetical protein AGMMS49525_01560 [Bacteroidia bacterium]|nr:hypothetical protein AGMMS49525_01560 [Bacteroidia bacterium]
MKNKILITFLVLVGLSCGNAAAQSLPKTSAEEDPAWYYIQVQGSDVEYSTEKKTVWYNLVSGKTGTANLAMQDNTSITLAAPANYALSVEPLNNDATQQWKLTKNASGTVTVTNRATNNAISTTSVYDEPYNLTQLTAVAEHAGHLLTDIGGGQYTLSAVEDDGIKRYLSLSEEGKDPEEFIIDKLTDSGFAWTFVKVIDTGINKQTPSSDNQLVVTVKDRVISVENATDWRIFSVDGKSIGKGTPLAPGVYLVTANGVTTKVLVK